MLKDIVLASNSFFFLQKKIVSARNLVVLVILNESRCLLKIIPVEVITKLIDEFRNHWNTIFTDYYTLHLNGADLSVPVMGANILDGDALGRIRVQDLLH